MKRGKETNDVGSTSPSSARPGYNNENGCSVVLRATVDAFLFQKPSCVYKFEEGEGDERRRLYISFECAPRLQQRKWLQRRPASHSGRRKLDLIRGTTLLRMLFA
uniref:Uncharacterized protein n=1 Tax=Steinernema glaseri TaxID=37863 RepID=A0A1I7ZT19_9BILA